MTTRTRSPLRYPGGKTRAVSTLLPLIPDDVDVVSPFVGGGSVEIALASRGQRVMCGDACLPLSNFWRALIDDGSALADSISPFLGKVDAGMFSSLKSEVAAYDAADDDADIDIEMAAAFFVVNRCSFSGATMSGGFSRESARTRFTPSSVERVRSFSLPGFDVVHSDFADVIDAADDNAFLFLDPPYLLPESASRLYGIAGDKHAHFDHERLHDLVSRSDHPFLLTYNDCDVIRTMWSGFHIESASWSYGMNSSKKSSEILITNR